MLVYMGCLTMRYGPEVISSAPTFTCEAILKWPIRITKIAHTPKTPERIRNAISKNSRTISSPEKST